MCWQYHLILVSLNLTVHLVECGQVGQVFISRGPWHGRKQTRPGLAHRQLLPGRQLHLPGLHRLDGRGHEEWVALLGEDSAADGCLAEV